MKCRVSTTACSRRLCTPCSLELLFPHRLLCVAEEHREELQRSGRLGPRRKRLFGQELSAAEEAELAAEDAAAERWITARTGGHSN